jgi:signal recognition particle subunit SRP54
MASRILDMGDVLTLIEQAEKAFDHGEAAEMTRKFMEDEDFTFDDFLNQMAAIKKMGSLKAMLKMMPGMGQMRDQLDSLDESEFDRVEAMVRSMTPFERTHPKQINGSRRGRIARGSGVTVTEVNGLLERFGQAQKMMRSMRRGGGSGIPGMPAIPGMGGAKKGGKGQQRKKGKSGNPAKRAQEEKAAAQKSTGARIAKANSAFGMPGATDTGAEPAPDKAAATDPASLDLPKGFEKFLGK